jgi:hypothetical protein
VSRRKLGWLEARVPEAIEDHRKNSAEQPHILMSVDAFAAPAEARRTPAKTANIAILPIFI